MKLTLMFYSLFSVSRARLTERERESESESESEWFIEKGRGPNVNCGDEHSQATLSQRKVHRYNICSDKTVSRTSKALCRKVASRSWRYLFSEANNIDSLKSDGHLTYMRGIYLSLRSLYIGT